MLLACPKPVEDSGPLSVESSAPREALDLLSGHIVEGVFKDSMYDIEIPISEEWKPEIGDSNGALRLRLEHQIYALSIEYWLFNSLYDSPIPSERCQWSFTDRGFYSQFTSDEQTIVASCEYDEQRQLVFAIVVPEKERTWQIEIHTDPSFLMRNLDVSYAQVLQSSLFDARLEALPSSDGDAQ